MELGLVAQRRERRFTKPCQLEVRLLSRPPAHRGSTPRGCSRDVAQPGSARGWGPRGRPFKSGHPDKIPASTRRMSSHPYGAIPVRPLYVDGQDARDVVGGDRSTGRSSVWWSHGSGPCGRAFKSRRPDEVQLWVELANPNPCPRAGEGMQEPSNPSIAGLGQQPRQPGRCRPAVGDRS